MYLYETYPLQVDCQASGLPHPAVRWNLPNGTILNSVLIADNNRGQKQQITVFDNGTLLVPAVGIEEEGEYMCYAENQAGQDTMKVCNTILPTEKNRLYCLYFYFSVFFSLS